MDISSTFTTPTATEMVVISATRLAELEKLAAYALHRKAQDNQRFAVLSERKKAHPEKAAESVRKWHEKNRDAYNARRRALRRQKKEAADGGVKSSGLNHPGTE